MDFGGSATKVLVYEGGQLRARHCFSSSLFPCSVEGIDSLTANLHLRTPIDGYVATGGTSDRLPRSFRGRSVRVISEIDALGVGGLLAAQCSSCLVVSIGTGTAMAMAHRTSTDGLEVRHVGGLGLGGGTLMGLGRLLCGINSFEELGELALEGNTEQVDLRVADIVGSGIGVVPGEVTASNFGKTMDESASFTRPDIAAGLMTLVGQSVARLAIVLSRQFELRDIVVIGQVGENLYLREVFAKMGELFDGNFVFVSESRYRVAEGAFEVARTSCFSRN